MRGMRWLEVLAQDLRYGLRILRNSPGFTAVAVLSLALGIGANTAIFSVVDAVLLKLLPVHKPEELVMVGSPKDKSFPYYPYSLFTHLRDNDDAFSGVFAIVEVDRSNLVVNGAGGGLDTGQVRVQLVSGNYFSVLGVDPFMGRTLTPDDDLTPGGHPVAVISAGYWTRRFAKAPDVVGRTVTLNNTIYSIIGVTPPGFAGELIGHPADLWIPIAMQSEVMVERPGLLFNPRAGGVRIVARLKPGITFEQARAVTEVVSSNVPAEQSATNAPSDSARAIANMKVGLEPASRGFASERNSFTRPLLVVWAVVGLVLLIACANVGNLLLARSSVRQKEIAIRLAIGAGGPRIIRQLLTESVLLALLGGALGLLFAYWVGQTFLKLIASGVTPIYLDSTIDARIFGFTAAVCVAAGILFGLAPAIRATRLSLVSALKGAGSATPKSTRRRFGLGKGLVVAQVALSLLVLIGAGLLIGTLRNLRSQEMGFDQQQVLLIWTAPAQAGRRGATLARLYEDAEQRLARVPGIKSVSLSSRGVFGNSDTGSPVSVIGYRRGPNDEYFVAWNLVAPRFFETVGMQLTRGRDFSPQDTEQSQRVAIINEAMARQYFGDQDPIGKRFGKGRDAANAIEIVGVVRGAKYDSLREKEKKMFFLPYRQDVNHLDEMCVVARTFSTPSAVAANIREELNSIDPNLPVISMDTIEEQVNRSLVRERLVALLSGCFGALALLLASIGLYGIVSYSVTSRTKEIGIRIALGASRANLIGMVLRESLLMIFVGVGVGLAITMGLTRLISSMLFGVSATDPLTILVAILVLTATGILAGYVPARRATKVDPMVALRV